MQMTLARRLRPILGLGLVLCLAGAAGAAEVVYSEGFEGDDGGYTSTGQWQWGTPSAADGPASHGGARCWGTNLSGDVAANTDTYLISPALALRSLGADEVARVRFFAWIAVDEMYDRGEFQVRQAGGAWETKAELFHVMSDGDQLSAPSEWREYYFDISDLAGGDVELRFRCYVDGSDEFDQSPRNMSGLYLDDLAVFIQEAPPVRTTLRLEAWEDQSSFASCPWVCPWDGSDFAADNDVYSTARGPAKEFTDYYTLRLPLVEDAGLYRLQLQETEDEQSWTDFAQLWAVDHAAGVEVAADENGTVSAFQNPSAPQAADAGGADVLGEVSSRDDAGYHAYEGDTLIADFGNVDVSGGATLVLRVCGFQFDPAVGAGLPTGSRPYVHVQTRAADGSWVTRHSFHPRWRWALAAYDLTGLLAFGQEVRLSVTSCHQGKYHIIDFVGLAGGIQPAKTVHVIAAASAQHGASGDVLAELAASDDTYAHMSTGEAIELTFPVPASAGDVRDFVFVCEGYYVPNGSYFVYTWNGSTWAQRDGWSIEGTNDQVRDFDLSAWLPDPAGQYRARIWQDYWYEPAGIDHVSLTRGTVTGTLQQAQDLSRTLDVTSELSASDDVRCDWPLGDYPNNRTRDRWVEVEFSGLAVNMPPTSDPVRVSGTSVRWSYDDMEGDPQLQYEVEVWCGPGGTGDCMWDPQVALSSSTSCSYGGAPLTEGETYYARVRVFDGSAWSAFAETSFVAGASSPGSGGGFADDWVIEHESSTSGCSLGAAGPAGLAPLLLVVATLAGARLGRRRRT